MYNNENALFLENGNLVRIVYWVIILYLLKQIAQVVYNVYFNPLAGIPGSKLAAASTEWSVCPIISFYLLHVGSDTTLWFAGMSGTGTSTTRDNSYSKLRDNMRDTVRTFILPGSKSLVKVACKGDIIRIGVNEVHINDPKHYVHVTSPSSQFLKDPKFYHAVGLPRASLALTDPLEHRIRKQVIAPAFSGRELQRLAVIIEKKCVRIRSLLLRSVEREEPINAHTLLKAYAIDIISEVVLGRSIGALESPGFHHLLLDAMKKALQGFWIPRAFPLLSRVLLNVPDSLARKVLPPAMIEVALVILQKTHK